MVVILKNNQYYQELLKNIEGMINKKQYQKVYELLKIELQDVSQNSKYSLKFSQLFHKVNRLMYSRHKNKGSDLDIKKVAEVLDAPNTSENLSEKISIIHQSKFINYNLILESVSKFFADKSQDAVLKTMLLQALKEQNIDKTFLIWKHEEEYKINPVKIVKLIDEKVLKNCTKILEKVMRIKFPHDFSLAHSFLSWYVLYIYPKVIQKEQMHVICAAIHYYIWHIQQLDVKLQEIANFYDCNVDELKIWVNKIQSIKTA